MKLVHCQHDFATHDFAVLWNAIAQSRVQEAAASGGYRLTLPDAAVFTRSSSTSRWEIRHYTRLARTLTASRCSNPCCGEFWRNVEPALEYRLAQYVRARAAVGPLLQTYRRAGAYLPASEVTWWLRQSAWLVWLESARAAAEEAFMLAAAAAAAEQLRVLARGEIVDLDASADDDWEPTILGTQLQDTVLQVVLPDVVPATAPRACSSFASPVRSLRLVWSAPW